MNKDLTDFVQAAKDADVALIYYAGHGVQVSGENYLIPIDADPLTEADVPGQSLSAASVLLSLGSLSTRLNFLILDACRDNPFATRSLFLATRGIAPPSGLAEMTAPQGTMIWYATGPGKKAQDGTGDNGPYALAMSHFVNRRGLDVYGFFNQSGLEVLNSTNKYQQPWLATSVVGGTYYFVGTDGRPAFVPYSESLDRGLGAANLANSLFSDGLQVPGRDFQFGSTYATVNSLLDSSFRIENYNSLPTAGEYGKDNIKYFWVYLSGLPVVQSALGNLTPEPKCIDPQSYITFFFKEGQFFRISIRLYRSSQCRSYDWLRAALFGPIGTSLELKSAKGPINVLYHEDNVYSYSDLEIFQKGVARDDQAFFGIQ